MEIVIFYQQEQNLKLTSKENVDFPIDVFGEDNHNLHKFLILPIKEWFRDMINDFPIFIWDEQIKVLEELREKGILAQGGAPEAILWYDKYLSQFDELRDSLRYDPKLTCPECGTWDISYVGASNNAYACECHKCEHEFVVEYKEDE